VAAEVVPGFLQLRAGVAHFEKRRVESAVLVGGGAGDKRTRQSQSNEQGRRK
jgi:hypothetical protein